MEQIIMIPFTRTVQCNSLGQRGKPAELSLEMKENSETCHNT